MFPRCQRVYVSIVFRSQLIELLPHFLQPLCNGAVGFIAELLCNLRVRFAVFPEQESGLRLAKNLLTSGFLDIIELSKDVSIVEIDVRPEWVGKCLLELELRKRHRLNAVAIVQNGKTRTDIDPEEPLSADMKLVVIANVEKLNRLLKGGLS